MRYIKFTELLRDMSILKKPTHWLHVSPKTFKKLTCRNVINTCLNIELNFDESALMLTGYADYGKAKVLDFHVESGNESFPCHDFVIVVLNQEESK